MVAMELPEVLLPMSVLSQRLTSRNGAPRRVNSRERGRLESSKRSGENSKKNFCSFLPRKRTLRGRDMSWTLAWT